MVIVTAEKDEIVPKEIPARLFESAQNATSRLFHTVRDCPHKLFPFLNQSPADRAAVVQLLRRNPLHKFGSAL